MSSLVADRARSHFFRNPANRPTVSSVAPMSRRRHAMTGAPFPGPASPNATANAKPAERRAGACGRTRSDGNLDGNAGARSRTSADERRKEGPVLLPPRTPTDTCGRAGAVL